MMLKPDFVSVTYGAGGSNQERSFAIVEYCASRVPTIGHLTCVGASRESAGKAVERLLHAPVAAILAIRGDARPELQLDAGELPRSLDLINLVRESSDVEVGVAAFPEGHPESTSFSQDIEVLKLKQDAGASFAITQMFFFAEDYFELVNQARAAGVTMPIVPGLMPITKLRQVVRMAELSAARVPNALVEALEAADEQSARQIGMDFTAKLGRELLDRGAPGLHIFCLNQSDSAVQLVETLGLSKA
ncbi:MAG: hypothetical protein RLZZ400_285 [Actinomycetota bacterium]